jgi:integrase
VRDRVLKPRTVELYDGLLANHLFPAFGNLGMADIDEAAVRRWRKERLEAGPKAKRPFGPVTVAKAYRLLHAIFETAAEEDRIVARNPCHIEGAGKEDSDERDIVPLPVVFKLAEAVPVRYRALILLATFADMRWGELAGLRRESIDLVACEIRIAEALIQPDKGGLRFDTPKSRAGKRTVAFPEEVADEIRWHLERFAEPGPRGLVFVGPKGGKLRRSNFHESVWSKARIAVGLPDLHLHDLRHTGGTLSAATGATLKELMARLGHSSVRAAMIYQHATRDRDQAIAKALGTFVREARKPAEKTAHEPERDEEGA